MGRHNHENSVAIPGYGKPVVLSGDDTFTSGPLTGVFPAGRWCRRSRSSTPTSRRARRRCWRRQGRPVGVRLRHAGREELLRRRPRLGDRGQGTLHQGAEGHRHRPQPRRLGAEGGRQGLPAAAHERQLADRPPRAVAPVGIDGPQWVLEYWSDINNVFQFVRVEDIAYDKRPGMGNVVYVVDSGRGRTRGSEPRTRTSGRRTAVSGRWCSTGRTRRR